MESAEEEDSGGKARQAASIEELRNKRLAYFSSPERGSGYSHQVSRLESPKLSSSGVTNKCAPGYQPNDEPRVGRAFERHLNEESFNRPPLLFGSSNNLESVPTMHDDNFNLEPNPSFETPCLSAGVRQFDRGRGSAADSHDYDPVSVFNSQASFSDLGLSTHRPEAVPGTHGNGTELDRCVFLPSSNGPGKMARDIFGEKTSEEMRNALGDEGFADLMLKVDKNLSQQREQSKSSLTDFNANNRAGLPRTPVQGDGRNKTHQMSDWSSVYQKGIDEMSQSSVGTNMITKNLQQLKEGDKKVFTLSRNYDQVTVPRNTRNSFSADEIYQQAFGGHQDPSLSFERNHSDRYHGHHHQRPWSGHMESSSPMEGYSNSGRRLSHDSAAGIVHHASPHSHPHMTPMACPPMHVPPPGYTSSHMGPSMSPHSAGQPSSPFAYPNAGHPGFFYPGQFRSSHGSAQSQYHPQGDQAHYRQPLYPPYVPQSPSAVPQSPNGFYYPPPPYSGGQYSVPRFPYGVPLHLPPPPIPPQMKQSAPQQAHATGPNSGRRNSLTLQQGAEDGMARKVPHPPHIPPALKSRDGEKEMHSGLDHRRISAGGGGYPHVPSRLPSNSHQHHWEGEGPSDHYNLQRYFSSLELHHRNPAMDAVPTGAPLDSSRSVEGDFYKANLRKSNTSLGHSEDYEDGENDDTASLSSGFTSVTANTATTGKVGGLTRRLENLGIDLEHLRHLRVVDKKHDQEASDANFEKLSKGIRYCPECGAANKAYMDWCLGCGEILIGVEPSLPGQRNRQGECAANGNGAGDKRSGRSSATGIKSNNKAVGEQWSGGRDSSRKSERQKSRKASNSRVLSKTDADPYTPQESPESGKGLSLSSSPVRYRREQEDTCEEPKDSGRASSSDLPERSQRLLDEGQRESEDEEEEGCSADDLEVMDEEDFVEEEGVEYDYQDSEPNFFEQIKDPVLRDFIISYRNKQIMKEGQKLSGGRDVLSTFDDAPSDSVADVGSRNYKKSSEKYDGSVKTSSELISSVSGTRTSQFNISLSSNQGKSLAEEGDNGVSHKENQSPFEGDISGLCDEDSRKIEKNAPHGAEGKTSKKERKKKKRRKKVEPMDVEIFGYEEIRQSRDSSRASNTHSIPLLNLRGSSEEEEDSSDEDGESQEDSSDEEENFGQDYSHPAVGNGENFHPSQRGQQTRGAQDKQHFHKSQMTDTSTMAGARKGLGDPSQPRPSSAYGAGKTMAGSPSHSQSQQRRSQTSVANSTDAAVYRGGRLSSQAGRGRQDQQQSGYQRHWARSSTAWSSYHPRELSTRSSLNMSVPEKSNRTFKRVGGVAGESSVNSNQRESSVRGSQSYSVNQNGHVRGEEQQGKRSRPNSGSSVSSGGGGSGSNSSGIPIRQRPSSAEYGRRAPTEPRQRPLSAQVRSSQGLAGQSRHQSQCPPPRHQPKVNNYMSAASNGRDGSCKAAGGKSRVPASGGQESNGVGQSEDSTASPRLLCPELHRLPHCGSDDEHADKLHATAKNSYDKLQQMTPRISGGEVSIWQCLPDELWLYVFEFVSHADLGRLMRSCQYFYRLANDETLWRYITVRPKLAMQDDHLAAIAQHRPLSLAMVMCNGRDLSEDSLHSFFRETQGRLKELNICGCSHGTLGGSLMLETAAQYCCGLTHLDASYCNLTDASLEAIAQCADSLESLCVNGFQSMSDACLLKVLRKHGRGLKTLELYACFSLSASSLRSLGEHCSNLKKLCLGSCNKLTDSAMITLSTHLARIEELDLRGCKNLKNDCIRKIVRNCPRLSKLVLANCPHISDLALTEIATHLKTTLRTLELCGCNNVTDQGVTTLAKNCDRLVSVDISSTKCSSVSVYQLGSNSCSRWLETVKLSFLTPLTEASVISLIRQCPRLKVVHVFGCTSLRNLAKLRLLNKKLSLQGDENVNFLRFSLDS